MRPVSEDIPQFYRKYVDQIEGDDLTRVLEDNLQELKIFFSKIPEDKYEYAYDVGKWTIKEIVNHIIDGERVFQYRALRFARNDKTELSGFDEKTYTPEAKANQRDFQDLTDEFEQVRKSTISLFNSFTEEMLQRKGLANETEMSVLALGFVIAGHSKHHLNVIKERYL